MKILASWFNGAVTLTWDGSKGYLNFDEALGGGAAAGILSGKGSLCLGVMNAIELGETEINKIVPAPFLPMVQALEAIANPAIANAIGSL